MNVALFPSKALTVHRSGVESENDDVIRKRSLIRVINAGGEFFYLLNGALTLARYSPIQIFRLRLLFFSNRHTVKKNR